MNLPGRTRKSSYYLIVGLLIGCHSGSPVPPPGRQEVAIEKACSEFNLQGLSYLIACNGKIVTQQFQEARRKDGTGYFRDIIDNFAAPVLLKKLIEDSLIKEDWRLDSLLPSVKNKQLRVKDLILVPASPYVPELEQTDLLAGMIKDVICTAPKKRYADPDRSIRLELGLSGSVKDSKALLYNLLKISDFFDRNNIQYSAPGPSIANLFPTWYTRGLRGFFGWNILKISQKTILWNYFTTDKENLLLLKFMDEDIFVATCYPSALIPSPLSYNKKDLLQSPLAIALLKSILFPSQAGDIDYRLTAGSIGSQIEKSDNTPYHILYRKDLIAHARMFEYMGNNKQANVLYEVYKEMTRDSLLPRYVNAPALAEMNYISDDLNASAPFELKEPARLRVFAGGQVALARDHEYYAYQYDNVGIVLNPQRPDEKVINGENTRVFRFNYRSNNISGSKDDKIPDSWLKNTAIKFAFGDPSDSSYILEVKIPWREVIQGNHKKITSLGVNVFVSDSDLEENGREGILSWSAVAGEGWDDPYKFGTLSLSGKGATDKAKRVNSLRVRRPPVIDGWADKIWDKAGYVPISNLWLGNVSSSVDCSGRFKTVYDDHYLYFLFNIADNCKNKAGIITTDKCWIENALNGEVVWKMTADTASRYLPSFLEDQELSLKAGSYVLRYRSDARHSFEEWYGPVPQDDVYGASIYISE